MSPNRDDASSHILLDLSAKIEYAILALIELASNADAKHPLTITEITNRHPIPDRYLEQIFTLLRRGGIIQSQRGAKGGYVLVKEPWQVTVLDIITLIEGNRRGANSQRQTTIEQELIHEIWHQANATFQSTLRQYTLQDLCQRRDLRKQMNHMYYI